METPDEHTEAVMKMLYDVHPYDVPKISISNLNGSMMHISIGSMRRPKHHDCLTPFKCL